MGWSLGYDSTWERDIGYGVPAYCDHPDCDERIDRGLGYVCGGEPYGGDTGCGLYFCGKHLRFHPQQCERCEVGAEPFDAKPDHPEWIRWKLTHESWAEWRVANPDAVLRLSSALDVEVGRHGSRDERAELTTKTDPAPTQDKET